MWAAAWARPWTTRPAEYMGVLRALKQSRSTGIGRQGRSRSERRRSGGWPSSGQMRWRAREWTANVWRRKQRIGGNLEFRLRIFRGSKVYWYLLEGSKYLCLCS